MEKIAVRRHPRAKILRKIRDGQSAESLFVEGSRLAQELLKSPLPIKEYYATQSAAERQISVINQLNSRKVSGTLLMEEVMDFVSDVASPPGLIVIANRPSHSPDEVLSSARNPLIVILDGLQQPSNVGAIIRVAEAAGATAVWPLTGGADPYGPKSLRASAGAAFRFPVFNTASMKDVIPFLKRYRIAPVAADPKGPKSFSEWDWSGGTALLLGEEARGLRPEMRNVPPVKIPMSREAESLNVAVAAGILLYEARRQRASG